VLGDDNPKTRALTLLAIDTQNILVTCHYGEGYQAYTFLVCGKGRLPFEGWEIRNLKN